MLLSTNGKIGINESSPDRQLHVRSDGAAAAKLGGESGAAYYMEIGQLASSGSLALMPLEVAHLCYSS